MALLDRLAGLEEPKIGGHKFWAGMVELSLGEVTVAQFKTYFDLSGQDATDFDWLVTQYQASTNKPQFIELMHVMVTLAEGKVPGYLTNADWVARIGRAD